MAEVTEAEIRRLRRLVAETGEDSTYTDEELTEYLNQAEGRIYWAAAEICQEKAAAAVSLYDFSADGGTYNRGEIAAKWQKMADYYKTLGGKKNGGTIRLKKWPQERQFRDVLHERTEVDA